MNQKKLTQQELNLWGNEGVEQSQLNEMAGRYRSDSQVSTQSQHSTYYVWQQHEEELLMHAIQKLGKQWRKVQETHFPTLNPTQIKNKYYQLIRKDQQLPQDDNQLSAPIHYEQVISTRQRAQTMQENTAQDILQSLQEILQNCKNK